MVVALVLLQGSDVGKCAEGAVQNRFSVFLVRSGLSSVRHAFFLRRIGGEAICPLPLLPSCIEDDPSGGVSCGGESVIFSVGGGRLFLETNGGPQIDRWCASSLGSVKCSWGAGVDDGAGGEAKHVRVDWMLPVTTSRYIYERCQRGRQK